MTSLRLKTIIAGACGALLTVSVAQAQTVGFAASNPGSLYHTSATAISKMATDKTDIKITVQPFASATVYLPAVDAGEFAFGLSNVEELRVAVVGEQQFEGRKYEDLRAVAITYPLRVAFFVKNDSPIKTIADLKGKRVVDGFASQKTIPPLLDAEYATAGMTRADIIPVPVTNVVGGANAFIQGKADAFFFAIGAPKVREADASVGGIRALNIEDTPENRAIIAKHFPPAYLRSEKPSKPNVGVVDPVSVITYDAVVVGSTKTPDDLVYKMVKAMHDNKKDMAAVFPVFNLFNPNRMASELGPIQWHPGTVKYLKEQGMWPPKAN
ncbi:MAG: TAXI family TRAP transporter solute-binding subunit [Alphaproteobacteria bacterium]|nr:TAXI family TRAP transporter solute-binding subunit [Alphaproteobacteria bacterium]